MERGQVKITVAGKGFINLPTLACRFGLTSSSAPAHFVSSENIQCLTPVESEPGIVSLDVTLNGVDFTAQGVSYEFLTMASLSALTPSTGLVSGGMPVVVSGTGFAGVGREGAHVTCRWEMSAFNPNQALVTRASVISDSNLTCAAPSAGQAGSAYVSVFADDVNIADEDDVTLVFEYKLRPTIVVLAPSHGPPSGGTTINVTGDGFSDGSGLSCRFHSVPVEGGHNGRARMDLVGVVDVAAEFLSTTEVHCVSPSLDAIYPQGGSSWSLGHALLEVSNHGWTSEGFDANQGLSFWYRPQPKVRATKS